MSIKIAGLDFTGPHYLKYCNMPSKAGIYAIMIETGSKQYTIVYIGETSDFSDRVTLSHHKYDCWNNAGRDIHFGLYEMPNSTSEERLQLEQKLISTMKPFCNG